MPHSTSTKITSAIASVILNRLSIWLAFDEPPDSGVKNASVAESRWPKAAGILFRPGREALDDVCHEPARRGAHAPLKRGGRFCTNAIAPSTKSSLPAISCWILASSSSCSSILEYSQLLSWRFEPA
jgi:hypothetical protein